MIIVNARPRSSFILFLCFESYLVSVPERNFLVLMLLLEYLLLILRGKCSDYFHMTKFEKAGTFI